MSETPVVEKTLAAKLAEAMAAIGAVTKDGQNNLQKYQFQSEAAIKAAVKKAISAVGVIIIPEYVVINQADRQSEKGKMNHFVDVMGTFTITDGKENIVGTMPGTGQDTGDKAIQKACTSAQKYFYKQLFNITDQDEDPDGDNSEPMAKKPTFNGATLKQIEMINVGLAQMNESKPGTGDSARGYFLKMYHVGSVNELSTEQASSFIKTVNEKVAKYNQERQSQLQQTATGFDNAFAQ